MAYRDLVLLVNDIPDHIAAYHRALSDDGFRVRLARTGRQALDILTETQPACSVIDLRLPDMSGWDLCRDIKAQHELSRGMPIVVLTPHVSKDSASDSAKVGCDAWLAHPAVAEDLVRTVRRVLSMESVAPATPEEALLGLVECTACGSDRVRPTLRVSPIQYYSCRACGFCWRAEVLQAQ